MPHIAFSGTSDFRPYLPDAHQVSSGSYGFELAVYLSQSLAGKRIFTSYPFCLPDRVRGGGANWFLEYKYSSDFPLAPSDRFFKNIHNDARFLIGICTECNDEDGYSEETSKGILWHIDIEDDHPQRVRAAGTDYAPVKVRLAEIIIELLNSRGIKSECSWI